MKIIGVSSLILACLALMSCATNQKAPSYASMLGEITGQNGRACVRTSDIDGYGVLKGDVVSIDGGFNYYLATVLPGCIDLSTSIGVMFSSDFGEICGQSMDRMYTRDNRCVINKMYEFESREEAFEAYNQAQQRREEIRAAEQ